MPELLNQAQYGEHRGVSRAAVHKKIKSGALGKIGAPGSALSQDDKGRVLIDPEIADRLWDANTDPTRAPKSKPGPAKVREERDDGQARALKTLTELKAETETSKALKAKIEVDKLRKKVLDRAYVEDVFFRAMRATRDRLRVMPTKLAQELAYAGSPEECRQILERETKLVLDDLFRRFQDMSNTGGDSSESDKPSA